MRQANDIRYVWRVLMNNIVDCFNDIYPISSDKMIKWKNENNQVTFESDKYYYKLYEEEIYTGKYNNEIRLKLADIYKNDYGLDWEVRTLIRDNLIYTAERREKLILCDERSMSFSEILSGWKNTLNKLENNLRLNFIAEQIREVIPRCNKLLLLREACNKADDYALGHNGEIILLDDTDFYLVMLDNENQTIFNNNFYIDVLTTCGELTFTANRPDQTPIPTISTVFAPNNYLFGLYCGLRLDTVKLLMDQKQKMLLDNISFITSNNKSVFYESQYIKGFIDDKR